MLSFTQKVQEEITDSEVSINNHAAAVWDESLWVASPGEWGSPCGSSRVSSLTTCEAAWSLCASFAFAQWNASSTPRLAR